MTQISEKDRARARALINRLAPLIVRVGRTFVQCVQAPNREENESGEEAFADALYELGEAIAESDNILK